MPGMAIVLLILLAFIVYVGAKVYQHNKESQAAWDQADKTKLREWEDEEDDKW